MKNYLILTLLFLSHFSNAQIGRLALSPHQVITQKIAKTEITINYSRPLMRDRIIFGGLVPYGEYWRTGANRNTTIEFDQTVFINDQKIEKGKYALFTKPGKEEWEFILYDETTNWYVPDSIEASKVICKTILKSEKIHDTVQALSFSFDNLDNYKLDVSLQWENTKLVIPITLTTKTQMETIINDELSGPKASDYYSAAIYQLESEKNFQQGLEWINQGMAIRKNPQWFDYRAKALLLLELKKFKECKTISDKGLKLAKKRKSNYGIDEFNRINKLLEAK